MSLLANIQARARRVSAAGKDTPSGVAGERARVAAIIRAPEGKGREELVRHLAFETNLSAPQAIAALKALPIGTPLQKTRVPVDRELGADYLAALDAAIGRQIAKHPSAPWSADAAERALLDAEFRASPTDAADVALHKASGRQLLKQFGVGKAKEYLKRTAGHRASGPASEPRSGRILAAEPRR